MTLRAQFSFEAVGILSWAVPAHRVSQGVTQSHYCWRSTSQKLSQVAWYDLVHPRDFCSIGPSLLFPLGWCRGTSCPSLLRVRVFWGFRAFTAKIWAFPGKLGWLVIQVIVWLGKSARNLESCLWLILLPGLSSFTSRAHSPRQGHRQFTKQEGP